MTKNRKNWLIYGLIVLVAGLLIFSYIKNKNKPRGQGVTIDKVTARTIDEIVSASGKIFPENEVKISSDVSGEITGLYVKEGDTVKAGQLLARINPDSYIPSVARGEASVQSSKTQEKVSQTQILNAQAQVEQVKAQLTNAKQIHDRNTKLFKDGVISQADLETSQANLDGLLANLKVSEAALKQAEQSAVGSKFGTQSAQASLNELKTSLNKTMIYAPVDGVISSLNVEKGERVVGTIQMSGTEMMTIANLNVIEVQVEVSENDIVRVSNGDTATIEVDAYYGRTFKGVVTEIANSAATSATAATTLNSDQVTNFVVKIRMMLDSYKDMIQAGKPFPFRPGMSASVEINTHREANTPSVPIQAVTTREEEIDDKSGKVKPDLLEVVFILSGDTAKMVEVKTGIQDDEFIQVIEGLKSDEKVITGPYSVVSRILKQGDKVFEEKEEKEDKLTAKD